MNKQSNAIRGALIGATAALSILAAMFGGGCTVNQPYDFPAMRLTSPPAPDAEPSQ